MWRSRAPDNRSGRESASIVIACLLRIVHLAFAAPFDSSLMAFDTSAAWLCRKPLSGGGALLPGVRLEFLDP
jgi:hypothetical protein